MRGDVPPDATVPSASAGTDGSVRGIPPSNKVPTVFLVGARAPTTRSLVKKHASTGSGRQAPAHGIRTCRGCGPDDLIRPRPPKPLRPQHRSGKWDSLPGVRIDSGQRIEPVE